MTIGFFSVFKGCVSKRCPPHNMLKIGSPETQNVPTAEETMGESWGGGIPPIPLTSILELNLLFVHHLPAPQAKN